jgi:hypothetical protein
MMRNEFGFAAKGTYSELLFWARERLRWQSEEAKGIRDVAAHRLGKTSTAERDRPGLRSLA